MRDFLREVVGGPATLTCNSVGGIAGLQVRGYGAIWGHALEQFWGKLCRKTGGWARGMLAHLAAAAPCTLTAQQRCCRAAVTRPTRSVSPATFATQAAIDDPALIKGVQIMNISLRMLHVSKQAPWQRPLVKALQVRGCGWMRKP